MTIYETPVSPLAIGGLALLGAYAAARGARLMSRGLRDADALDLVRGIRFVVIAFVSGLAGLGVASGHRGLVVIAGLILAEEIYETGTLVLIIRIGGKAAPLPGTAPFSGTGALPGAAPQSVAPSTRGARDDLTPISPRRHGARGARPAAR